ncbi:hypothetical protein PP175_01450 [Aneurinibacillus sp. Ricciae_BoGa-3]|nr:hypothetical protein [Aneurinibacillus sp. Ricciae_BoGa-3]WCK54732.1 hypothetical protein PP175_01450 [Aneurinibacillus sp. Ricciae_BoGa-3]
MKNASPIQAFFISKIIEHTKAAIWEDKLHMLTLENTLLVFNDREFEPLLPWNQRYRINMDKIKTGDIQEGAEVICDLMHMNETKRLNTSERRMLDNAKDILTSELALVKGFTENQAIDFLNEEVY